MVRNLQIIGQAIKDVSTDVKEQTPDVDWHQASRMRDKVTHDYLEVDYEIVWKTVRDWTLASQVAFKFDFQFRNVRAAMIMQAARNLKPKIARCCVLAG